MVSLMDYETCLLRGMYPREVFKRVPEYKQNGKMPLNAGEKHIDILSRCVLRGQGRSRKGKYFVIIPSS